MNRYYQPETLRILSESQVRAAYPNTCFSDPFSPPTGWFLLQPMETKPTYDVVRQRLVDQTPSFTGGQYREVLSVDTYPVMIQEARFAAETSRLISKIDGDVDSVYARVIGNRGVEYQIAYAEAKEWEASGYVGDPPFSVTSHVDGYGISAETSVAEILATGDSWYSLVRTMRRSRLKAKGLVKQFLFKEAETYWNGVMATINSQI